MALASFGKPRYARRFREHRPARAATGRTRSRRRGWRSGSGRRGARGGPLEQRHFDIAHSLQVVLEETVLELADWLHRATGVRRPLPGGRRRAELRDERPAARPRPVPTHLGPAGGRATPAPPWARRSGSTPGSAGDGSRLPDGPRLPRPGVRRRARSRRSCAGRSCRYRRLDDVAGRDGRRPGAGRGHRLVPGTDGVRAAGARGALDPGLADPRRDAGAAQRDQGPRGLPPGRPGRAGRGGARLVRRRRTSRRSCCSSTTCGPTRPTASRRCGTSTARPASRRSTARSTRSTTTCSRRSPRAPGVPVLVNTSFNTRGEPIVCTPRDAVECFWTSPLDALVIGSFLLEKPGGRRDAARRRSSSRPTGGPTCSTAAWPRLPAQDARRRRRSRSSCRRRGRATPRGGRSRPGPATGAAGDPLSSPVTRPHGPAAARNVGWRAARGRSSPSPTTTASPTRLAGRGAGGVRRDGAAAVVGPGRRAAAGAADRLRARRGRPDAAEFVTANCFVPPRRAGGRRRLRRAVSPRPGARTATCSSRCWSGAARIVRAPGRGRGPSGAAGRLGRQPAAAAQEPVQRAALQEASGAVPRADPGLAAAALLRDDRHDGRGGVRRGDQTSAGWRWPVARRGPA